MFDATKLLKINDMCNFCIIIILKFLIPPTGIGNIVITGGTIAAYGGVGAAGIGGGWCGGCQNITITDTVKKVTASKGNGAEHSIGAGKWPDGCGTVTIGGVVGAISQSPYTYEP